MKEGIYMSNQNYITEMLELKDNNVFFKKNCYIRKTSKESLIKFSKAIYPINLNFALNEVFYLMNLNPLKLPMAL